MKLIVVFCNFTNLHKKWEIPKNVPLGDTTAGNLPTPPILKISSNCPKHETRALLRVAETRVLSRIQGNQSFLCSKNLTSTGGEK